ncbi:MAG TPA: Rho termination factor [Acidimicrobiales bacterium]|nr:Rho termination factor [Acidimicrobiales bacterium]
MPRGKSHGPSVKRPEQYEAMRDQGMSKSKAARISNAGRSAARKGGRSPSYDDMSKDELMSRARQRNIAGRSTMTKGQLISALRK